MNKKFFILMIIFFSLLFIVLSTFDYYVDFPDSISIEGYVLSLEGEGGYFYNGLFTIYYYIQILTHHWALLLNSIFFLLSVIFMMNKFNFGFIHFFLLTPVMILIPQPNRECIFLLSTLITVYYFSDFVDLGAKIYNICFLLLGFYLLLAGRMFLGFLLISNLFYIYINYKSKSRLIINLIFISLIIYVCNSEYYISLIDGYFGNNPLDTVSKSLNGINVFDSIARFFANIASPIIHIFSQEDFLISYHFWIGLASMAFIFYLFNGFRIPKNIFFYIGISGIALESIFIPFVQSRYSLIFMLVATLSKRSLSEHQVYSPDVPSLSNLR